MALVLFHGEENSAETGGGSWICLEYSQLSLLDK